MIPEDEPIRTSTFVMDKASYSKVRIPDIFKQLGPAFYICLALILGATIWESNDPTIRQVSLVAIGFILIFMASMSVVIFQRIYGRSSRALFSAERKFEFTETTIHSNVTGFGESKFGWSIITRIITKHEWTMLMYSSAVAVAVPNSAFVTADDLTKFQDLVARKRTELKRK